MSVQYTSVSSFHLEPCEDDNDFDERSSGPAAAPARPPPSPYTVSLRPDLIAAAAAAASSDDDESSSSSQAERAPLTPAQAAPSTTAAHAGPAAAWAAGGAAPGRASAGGKAPACAPPRTTGAWTTDIDAARSSGAQPRPEQAPCAEESPLQPFSVQAGPARGGWPAPLDADPAWESRDRFHEGGLKASAEGVPSPRARWHKVGALKSSLDALSSSLTSSFQALPSPYQSFSSFSKGLQRLPNTLMVRKSIEYDKAQFRPWFCAFTLALNVASMVYSLYLNDCPRRSTACKARALGRFAFESDKVNPLYGPRAEVLVRLGAKEWWSIVEGRQAWRLVSATWIHAGVIHLGLNMLGLVCYGVRLEGLHGAARVAALWAVCGSFSMICSAVFLPKVVTVGASGSVCGLIGGDIADLLLNWAMYETPWTNMAVLIVGSCIEMLMGLAPLVDNVAHVSGLICGVLAGCMLFMKERYLKTENLNGSQTGLTSLKKLQRTWAQWGILLAGLLLLPALFFIGVLVLYAKLDMTAWCPQCYHINCLPTWFWECPDVDMLGTFPTPSPPPLPPATGITWSRDTGES